MFAGKDVRVFLKWQGKEAYLKLKKRDDKEARIILKSFERVKAILRDNPQYGQIIRKELIPPAFKRKGIKNLYRVEISNYWRAIYTIEGDSVSILLFVLTLMDHKEYNKLFGYK